MMPAPITEPSLPTRRHPALRARALAWRNRWHRWSRDRAQAAFHVTAGILVASVLLVALHQAWRGQGAVIATLASRHAGLVAVVLMAIAWRDVRAAVRRWREPVEHGLFAALPLSRDAHRRAGDVALLPRVAIAIASWLALVAVLAVAPGHTVSLRDVAVLGVAGIVLGGIAGRWHGWRGDAGVVANAPRAHVARTRARADHGLPHVIAWQRAAGLDAGASRRATIALGVLMMTVPGSETLRSAAVMLALFIVMVAAHSALSGALAVIAPLARLLRATPVTGPAVVAASIRLPLVVFALALPAIASLALVIGVPAIVASMLAASLAAYAALRIAAALRFRHEPRRTAVHVGVVLAATVALAQVFAPVAFAVLTVEIARLAWRARALP